MAARFEVVIDGADPDRLAEFWAAALGYQLFGAAGNYRSIVSADGADPKIIVQGVAEPKSGKNRVHIDLKADDIEAEAQRLIGLGARRLSGQPVSEHGGHWIVMADPEGNEFCVCGC